jgi:hypothetical protein
VDEEDDQVPAAVRLSERGINVLARAMTLLDEAEVGSSSKDLRYLTLLDAMLAPQLLDDVFEPDEAGNVQALVLFSSRTHSTPPEAGIEGLRVRRVGETEVGYKRRQQAEMLTSRPTGGVLKC